MSSVLNDSEIRRQPPALANILAETDAMGFWPEGHAPRIPALIKDIEQRQEFVTVKLAWASGLM